MPVAAVALGAAVIEKHFTLDKELPGPDHKASLEPSELAAMVRAVRQTEMALGTGRKIPSPSEIRNRPIARKSLVANEPVVKGELLTGQNLTVKRPGDGISPLRFWEYLGTPSAADLTKDEKLR